MRKQHTSTPFQACGLISSIPACSVRPRSLPWLVLVASLALVPGLLADQFASGVNQGSSGSWSNNIWTNIITGVVGAPVPGNTYDIVTPGSVRTPTNTGVYSYTFPGDSLSVNAGGTLSCIAAPPIAATTLRFPGVAGNPGLIFNGGTLTANSTTNFILDGNIQVRNNSALNLGGIGARGFIFAPTSKISGNKTLALTGANSSSQPLDIQSAGNSFAGTWFVGASGYLKGTASNSLGQASITVSNAAKFEPFYNIKSAGTINLVSGSNSVMVLHQNCLVGALVVSNGFLPVATYTYATLLAKYPSNFLAGGSGQIIVLPPPTNIVATAGSSQVSLSWNLVTRATNYVIYRATVSGGPYTPVATNAASPYVDTSVVNGTTYYYVLTSFATPGESVPSAEASAIPQAPPAAPTGLAALNGDGTVSLSWNTVPAATGYYVKRAAVSGGPYTPIATNIDNTFTDTGLVNGNTYYYVVSAYNGIGQGANSAEVIGNPNSGPTGLVAVGGVNQVVLTWTAYPSATSYRVKRSLVSGGPYTQIGTPTPATYTDNTARAGSNYFYVVSAMVGGQESGNSAEAVGLTAPAAPTGITANPINPSQIALSWVSANDPALTTFTIWQSRDNLNFVQSGSVSGTTTNFTASGLLAASPYYFKIGATNLTGTAYGNLAGTATTLGFTAKVNFANALNGTPPNNPAPAAAGYLVDVGNFYNTRTNGLVYGWDLDSTTNGVWRQNQGNPGIFPGGIYDVRYDTFNQMMAATPGRVWNISVPIGYYQVHVVGGDPGPGAPSITEQFNIEGTTTAAQPLGGAVRWAEFTTSVSVGDTRLTIQAGSSAVNNTLCYVDIQAVAAPVFQIVSQPLDTSVPELNGTATFTVGVSGPGPFRYQWYFNGTNLLTGQTAATLALVNPPCSAAGLYSVVVTDAMNESLTSRSARLTIVSDSTHPYLVTAAGKDGHQALVTFNKPVTATTANRVANYSITNSTGGPLAVKSAVLQANGTTVLLGTDVQSYGTRYTVVVANIADTTCQGNVVTNGTRASFTDVDLIAINSGQLTVEIYSNIMGNPANVQNNLGSLTNMPTYNGATRSPGSSNYVVGSPDGITTTSVGGYSFNSQNAVNYGAKIYGFFRPPSNGVYRFYVRSDDASNLYLNPGTNSNIPSFDPSGKILVAWENGCCGGFRGAAPFMSASFPMTAGQSYYIECLYEQGGGIEYGQFAFKEAGDPTDPPNCANDYNCGIASSIQAPFLATPILGFSPSAQPISQTVEQSRSVTFTFAGVPVPTYFASTFHYQWQKNSGAGWTDIPGANGRFPSTLPVGLVSYTLPIAQLTDNGALFRCHVTGPGVDYISDAASLTVNPDVTAPYLLSAGSLNGWQVSLLFDGRMDPYSVTQANLYVVDTADGTLAVSKATLLPDGQSVVLDIADAVGAPINYMDTQMYRDNGFIDVLAYTPISDLAGNSIPIDQLYVSANAGAPIQPAAQSLDITPNPIYPGEAFAGWPDPAIVVAAGGEGISTGTDDAFHYVYQPIFDDRAMSVHLSNMLINLPAAQAGLMFREGTNSYDRHYSILATAPVNNGGQGVVQVVSRTAQFGNGTVLTSYPLPGSFPNIFLKASHAGNTFSAFVTGNPGLDGNGTNWILINNFLDPNPYASVLAGPAASGFGGATNPVTAYFENWAFNCTPSIAVQPEPAAVTVGVLQNVTFSNLAISAACSVPVTYRWYKGTNALAGATGPNLTLYSVGVVDSGTYYAAVVSSSGVILSRGLQLTVTNQLPVVLPETNTVSGRAPVALTFADLLGNDHDPEGAPLTILAVNGNATNTFTTDFQSGVPSGILLWSNATYVANDGATNNGFIQFTTNGNEVHGWMIVSNLPPGNEIASFQASFDLGLWDGTVPNGGAGFCFAFTTNPPIPMWTGDTMERGVQNGLSVTYDSHTNADNSLPAFLVFWDNTVMATVRSLSLTNTPNRFVPVQVSFTNGMVWLLYDGTNVFPAGVQTPYVPVAGEFVLGARTGSATTGTRIYDVDNLHIQTLSSKTTPMGGTVVLNATATTTNIIYTPPATGTGLDWFLYLVSDGQLGGAVWDTKYLQIQGGTGPLPAVQITQIDATHYQIAWPAGTPSGVLVQYSDDLITPRNTWPADPTAVYVRNADGSGTATVTVPPGHTPRFYQTAQ